MPRNPNYRLLLKSKKRRQKRSSQKHKTASHSKHKAKRLLDCIPKSVSADTQSHYTIRIDITVQELSNPDYPAARHISMHQRQRLPSLRTVHDLSAHQLLDLAMGHRYEDTFQNPFQIPGNEGLQLHTKELPSIQQLTGIENEPW